MKVTYKNPKLLILFFVGMLFSACSNLIDDFIECGKSETSVKDDGVSICVDIDEKSARTALPVVTVDDISYISLMYADSEGETSLLIGSWNSVSELKESVLPFKVGTYNFTITAICKDVVLKQTKSYSITNGSNKLSFTPKITSISSDFSGKGSLNVSVSFNPENVKKVYGGVYTTSETKVAGFVDEELSIESGGKVLYSKENIPSGNYLVVFKFYADEEKKQLLDMYYEYASIVNGMTSASECVINELGCLFKIIYKLNDGAFAGGFAAPGTFSEFSSESIQLPAAANMVRDGYEFAGWYLNADFTGDCQTEISCGSAGNKTFYAKWLKKVTITFDANGTGAQISTNSQTVVKGQQATLKTKSELGLSWQGKKFYGWAPNADAASPSYLDGAEITVDTDSLVLYAIWSVSNINPAGPSDTTDTDGDGLSDWEEINTYFTDPSCTDTDGDGWSDGVEVKGLYSKNTNTFNPLIADTPQLSIRMSGKPNISYKYTLTAGGTSTETVTSNQGYTGSTSSTNSFTKTHTETHGWHVKAGVSVAHHWSPIGNPADVYKNTTTVTAEAGYNGSVANGDTYTYSQSTSEGWSKSWSNGKSTTNSSSKTVSGGAISIPVKFLNPSYIAYTVENVTVALYRFPNNSSDTRKFVKTLELSTPGAFVIPPQSESAEMQLKTDLGIGLTEELLKWSTGFEIEISGYKITLQKENQFANDFTETLTKVRAKTASVYIDWGSLSGMQPKTYNVSVKNTYNTEAQNIDELYPQPNLDYVFQNMLHYVKGVDYSLNSNECLEAFYRITNKAPASDGSLRDGAWFILHKYTTPSGTREQTMYKPYTGSVTGGWKFSDIKLEAGDEVYVFYSIDKDGDGVPLNEELIYGSDDTKPDTDGDGLTDYEEIYGWYKSHLESKYSSTNKVHTSAVLKDTDGDDLLDYTSVSSKLDTDPIMPKQSDDTSLGTVQYAYSEKGQFYNFRFNNSKEASLSGSCENLYLNILPKVSFAEVRISTSEDGNYAVFGPNTPIPLLIGKNTFYIKCTAPDGTTSDIYKINFDSSFKEMTNFKLSSPTLSNGLVNITWNSYSDARVITKNYGGYMLYAEKSDALDSSPVFERSYIDSALDNPSDAIKEKSSFYLKMPSLEAGNKSLELASNTNYCIYLFAYVHSDSDSDFKYKCLGREKIKTSVAEKAELIFYAHYIYDWKDQDGGCDPQYYWYFNGGELPLSELNVGSDNKKTFDDDDDKTYCFGEGKIHKYGNDPQKFSNCTKVIKKEFSRKKDISFTVTWNATEYDKGSPDDPLGTVTAKFTYTKSTDTWNCTWTSEHGASGTSTIKAGQRSGVYNGGYWNGNRWELHNSSEGEIDFHWDWAWDYKE